MNTSLSKNRLADSASAYLRQHENNPVDWYPWGPEAHDRSRFEHKPIFLSIGYSSCHWCHVMERESFSDPQVAEILNTHFVAIKLDREERPDLDALYMKSVQILTGHGGWPLNVFLTPELRPFFGGTYFPPVARYGQPAFRDLLNRIAAAYKNQPDAIKQNADQLTNILFQSGRYFEKASELPENFLEKSRDNLRRLYDATHGGLGQAPKFFHTDGLRLLLRGTEEDRAKALFSLKRIGLGGVYDHLGGGFHRYSTDAEWRVPHFEKMLYDNALLAVVYLEAFQVSQDIFFKRIVEETLDWALREMRGEDGLFYSAIDADSEHIEGLFYTWSFDDLQKVLGVDSKAKSFCERFGLSDEGNYEGRNILFLKEPLSEKESADFASLRERLLRAREKREWPLVDSKAQVSWNGLMISALVFASWVLNRDDYLRAATKAADRILETAPALKHVIYKNKISREGFLEDFAYFCEAVLDVYEKTGVEKYLESAVSMADLLIKEFSDEAGGFWTTAASQPDLLIRSKEISDSAVPAAHSVAISFLNRLYRLTGEARFSDSAEKALYSILGTAQSQIGGFNRLALVIDEIKNSKSLYLQDQRPENLDEFRIKFLPQLRVLMGRANVQLRNNKSENALLLCGPNYCERIESLKEIQF